MPITLSSLSQKDEQYAYQDLMQSHPDSQLYHSLSYHSAISHHLEADTWYILYYHQKELVAALPLMIKNHPDWGSVVNSLPYYGSNGAFIIKLDLSLDASFIRCELITAFEQFCAKNQVKASTIISNPFLTEDQQWLDEQYAVTHSDKRIGQITHLPSMSDHLDEELMKLFENPRPRNIRRAIKSGVTISECHDVDSLKFLYTVHKENIESIGGKAKRKDFFDRIPQFFSQQEFSVYVAHKDGRRIAALLLFYFNNTVEYFTPATLHDFRKDQPSALLIYQAMQDAVLRGYSRWNWGGTWLNQSGVYNFKKKWGAQDHEYHYYTRVAKEWQHSTTKSDLIAAFPYFYLWPY